MTSVAQVLHVTQIVGVLALLSSIFDWITLLSIGVKVLVLLLI